MRIFGLLLKNRIAAYEIFLMYWHVGFWIGGRRLEKREDVLLEALNERQRYILELVAGGKPYREIGAGLGISEGGVKYHMQKILNTLDLENKTQAIIMLVKYSKIG